MEIILRSMTHKLIRNVVMSLDPHSMLWYFLSPTIFQLSPRPHCQRLPSLLQYLPLSSRSRTCLSKEKQYDVREVYDQYPFLWTAIIGFFLNLVYFHGEYFRVNQLLVKHSLRIIWIFVLSFLFFMIIRRILTCHTRRCIQRWRCCRPRLDRLSQRFRRGLEMRFLIIIIYHNLLFWSRLFRRFFAMTETIVLSPSHHFCLL